MKTNFRQKSMFGTQKGQNFCLFCLCIVFPLLSTFNLHAQEISAAVDTTQIRIGEQITYRDLGRSRLVRTWWSFPKAKLLVRWR